MKREDFGKELKRLGFLFESDDEFGHDIFTNDHFILVTDGLKYYQISLVVYLDSYTARIVWRLDHNHKVTKSYYMHKEINECKSVVSFMYSFVKYCVDSYHIDMHKYSK